MTLRDMEHRYLKWALARAGGDRVQLAERLGISERTLYRKLREAREESGQRLVLKQVIQALGRPHKVLP